jgi:hypothetical protein
MPPRPTNGTTNGTEGQLTEGQTQNRLLRQIPDPVQERRMGLETAEFGRPEGAGEREEPDGRPRRYLGRDAEFRSRSLVIGVRHRLAETEHLP